MAEENYRKQWAEGEIEAGTLLDAIDALADENAKLRAIFDESERHLHHWHRQARSRALTIKGLEKELARQKLPEPRGSLAAQICKAQETVSQWPDDIRAQNGINAERLAPPYTHPPVVAETEPVANEQLIREVNYYYRATLRNVLKDIRDDLVRGGLPPSWEGIAETISVVLSDDCASAPASGAVPVPDPMPILKRLFAAETRKRREMASAEYRIQAMTDYDKALDELRALLAKGVV